MLRRLLTLLSITVAFMLITLAKAPAQESGQVTIAGTLIKKSSPENWLGLQTSSGHLYKLISNSAEVSETLPKLEEGDLVSGFGQIDNSSKVASLQSLNFIGLKRLLGMWWTNMGFADIQTFSEMNFYLEKSTSVQTDATIKKSYQYSISPTVSPSWVIFLADEKTVYYTSMDFQGNTAKMKMYHPETGVLMKTIDFTRINF